MDIDLRTASYEEFISSVFDHEPADDVDDKWFWKEEVEVQIEPQPFIAHLTSVFEKSSDLVDRFTIRQIAEGLEFLFCGPDGSGRLGQLWNPEVPWLERRRCILSIPNFYRQVFEPDDETGCGFMLWDWIAYGYESGNKSPANSPEDARVQDTMLEALTAMLASQSDETQAAAIHGLGHLHHRDSSRVITGFLNSSSVITPGLRKYAGEVLEGHFQ